MPCRRPGAFCRPPEIPLTNDNRGSGQFPRQHSSAMLLAYRELDDTLRLTDTGPDTLADVRTARTVAIGWRAFCANRCSAHLPGQWIDKVHRQRPPKVLVLVMDSSESRTYGDREIKNPAPCCALRSTYSRPHLDHRLCLAQPRLHGVRHFSACSLC